MRRSRRANAKMCPFVPFCSIGQLVASYPAQILDYLLLVFSIKISKIQITIEMVDEGRCTETGSQSLINFSHNNVTNQNILFANHFIHHSSRLLKDLAWSQGGDAIFTSNELPVNSMKDVRLLQLMHTRMLSNHA